MRKKAQIKFGETFAIIILVYIILVAGMVWYNKISTENIAQIQEDNKKDKAFEKYYYIINSPLLHKSEFGDIDEEFDLTALKIFKNYSNNQSNQKYIRSKLGYSTIYVKIIDKDFNHIENITIYNVTPTKITQQETFKSLIPVTNLTQDKTFIGRLYVTIYN